VGSLHSSFLPDHDEVAASLALSQGGPGCRCAMCLRLAAVQPSGQPAMPPGLGGWMRSMAGKMQSALAEGEEVEEVEPAASAAPPPAGEAVAGMAAFTGSWGGWPEAEPTQRTPAQPTPRSGSVWDAAYRAKAEAAELAGGEIPDWVFDGPDLDEQIEALAEELEAEESGC
jgi:hypothetical protein